MLGISVVIHFIYCVLLRFQNGEMRATGKGVIKEAQIILIEMVKGRRN